MRKIHNYYDFLYILVNEVSYNYNNKKVIKNIVLLSNVN